MEGYLIRNERGVKEIREGNVFPPIADLPCWLRHRMSPLQWDSHCKNKIAWENAKVIKIHPGIYWAFPDVDGKIEFALCCGGYAIPTNIAPIILQSKDEKVDIGVLNRRRERFMYPDDGGYRARRNARDGGL